MVIVFNDKHYILSNKVLVAGCVILNCLIIMVLTDRFTVKLNLRMTEFNISIQLTFQFQFKAVTKC